MGQMYTGHMLRPYVPLDKRSGDGHEEAINGSSSNDIANAARLASAMALDSRQVSCSAANMR